MTDCVPEDNSSKSSDNSASYSIPKEHRSLDYILSQIPRRAQKGILTTCDLLLNCVDATPEYIALGSNVGVVFLYNRKKEVVERLKTNSNSDVLTTIALHSGLEHQVAVGTNKGLVYIFQLPSDLPGQNKKLQQFVVKSMHKGEVTCTAWSINGMKLFSGDEKGIVVCTEFDTFQGQCNSAVVLTEDSSRIVQLSHAHKSLLVSTNHRTVIYKSDQTIVQVGQKERKILGPFGACFIPELCKPEDAQLFASRPGARVWKSNMNGTVSNTYLYKELLKASHTEIPLLFKERISAKKSGEIQFGPLLLYMDKYLVTWNEWAIYILNPENNSVVGSQTCLGSVVDITVTEDEIFVLRKNCERNLLRIAMYPEKTSESLYHRLLHEKEKYALMKQSTVPLESATDSDSKQEMTSPLRFLQTNVIDKIKSIDVSGSAHKSSVEHFISSVTQFHHDDTEEVTEHELDHHEHAHNLSLQSLHDSKQQDQAPHIKRESELHEELPPVIQLASPDLLTVEIFSGIPPNSENLKPKKEIQSKQIPQEKVTQYSPQKGRFNPFLKDDCLLEEQYDSTKTETSGHDLEKPNGSSPLSCQESVANPVIPNVMITEERLKSAVGAPMSAVGDDDIVFNKKHKKHKKKKKGQKSDSDGVNSPHSSSGADFVPGENFADSLSLRSDTASLRSDTCSVKSDASDDQVGKFSHESSDKNLGAVIRRVRSRDPSPGCDTGISTHLTDTTEDDKYASLYRSLDAFEKELTNSTSSRPEEDNSVCPEEKVTDEDAAESLPESSQLFHVLKTSDKASDSGNGASGNRIELAETLVSDPSNTDKHSETGSHDDSNQSIYATPDSSTDDFYTKYRTNSSVSSLQDVAEHPLLRTATSVEEEADSGVFDRKTKKKDVPSYKDINNWTEIFTNGNLSCLTLTNTHMWYVDRSSNVNYCGFTSGGLKWQKANGPAKMISVSRSGNIVWRLYKDTVFAGTKITSKRPEGMKWIEAVREVQYIAVDEYTGWYIKTNGDVMMQKGLSKERPCYKSIHVPCEFKVNQICCSKGVVWCLTDDCRLIYREGITKECQEGKSWSKIQIEMSHEMLFSCVSPGIDGVMWIIDVLGRIWFTTGVTMATPSGDGKWWEVPVSEILVQDASRLDALMSLAQKLDPQKLASLISSQSGGLIAAGKAGVWVCPEYKNMIQVCHGTTEGHLWEEVHLPGLASSVVWKLLSASGSSKDLIWAEQPNGDIYTFTTNRTKCGMVQRPSHHANSACLSACRDAVWILTQNKKIFIRDGVTQKNPHGVEWHELDLTQLGEVELISISCGTVNVWAVDTQGVVYQRIGVKAPSSHSLNAAWLPVDFGKTGTVFTHVASGPKDCMVWAIDNRRQVYARTGITDEMPIGEEWIHIPGTLASQLAVSDNFVWALNPNGEILCRYGITTKNPSGDYWRKVPGVYAQISVSATDEMWAINTEGQLFCRQTKYLMNSDNPFPKMIPKRSSASMSSDDGWELV